MTKNILINREVGVALVKRFFIEKIFDLVTILFEIDVKQIKNLILLILKLKMKNILVDIKVDIKIVIGIVRHTKVGESTRNVSNIFIFTIDVMVFLLVNFVLDILYINILDFINDINIFLVRISHFIVENVNFLKKQHLLLFFDFQVTNFGFIGIGFNVIVKNRVELLFYIKIANLFYIFRVEVHIFREDFYGNFEVQTIQAST